MSALDEVYTLAMEEGATDVEVLQRKNWASPWRLLAASLVGLAMVAAATNQVHVVPSLSTSSGAAELRSGRRLQEDLPQIQEGPQGREGGDGQRLPEEQQKDRQPDEDTSVFLDWLIFRNGARLVNGGKQLSDKFRRKWRQTSQRMKLVTALQPGKDLTIDWKVDHKSEITWVDVWQGESLDGEDLKDLQVLLQNPGTTDRCEYVSVVDGPGVGAAGVRFGCGTKSATGVIIRNVGMPARPLEISNVDLSGTEKWT